MKFARSSLLALAAAAASGTGQSQEIPPRRLAIQLSAPAFEAATNASPVVFVMFHAIECGKACDAVSPVWEALAKELSTERGVTVGRVDTDAEVMLGRRLGVRSYPTFMLFTRGFLVQTYEGDWTVAAFAAYARGGYGQTRGWPVPPKWMLPISDAAEDMAHEMVACGTSGEAAAKCAARAFSLLLLLSIVGSVAWFACGGGGGDERPPSGRQVRRVPAAAHEKVS